MNTTSSPYQPTLHSKRAGAHYVALVFISIFIAAGFYFAWTLSLQSDAKLILKLPYQFLWVFPAFILWLVWGSYRAIRIEQGMVFLRKRWSNDERQFAVSDITGHAILKLQPRNQAYETLRLRIRYSEDVDLHSSNYSNYEEIKNALVKEIPPDPAVQSKLVKRQQRGIVIFLAAMFVGGLIGWGFLFHEAHKPPLTKKDLQEVTAVLSASPYLDKRATSSGRNRRTKTYLVLNTEEYPGTPFELSEAALHATQSEEVLRLLVAKDSIRLLVSSSDFDKLRNHADAVCPCTLSGKGVDFLTLEAYNVQYKYEMTSMLGWLSFSLILTGLFGGWKYWEYRKAE